MTKALASYPEEQRQSIATRRLNNSTRGNGFWAAKAYFDKKGMRYPGKMGAAQAVEQATLKARIIDALGVKAGFHMPDDGPKQNGKLPRKDPHKNFRTNKNFKPHLNRMRVTK